MTNHENSRDENGRPRTPRRRHIPPEQMDNFIEIGDHHLPNFESLNREFDWLSSHLTDFRSHVAYRSLLSLFQATFVPSLGNAPNPYQDALIGELLAHGITPAEVARAMMQAGTSESVSLAIVGNAADSIADRNPRLAPPVEPPHPAPSERDSGADIKSVLFYIAEEQSRQKAYIHHGIRCDSCGEIPIRGIRWHCSNCTDFDLCSNCEAQNPSPHIKTHVFHKITIPALHLSKSWKIEPVWYPGNPFLMQRTLPKDIVRQLSNDCSYEPFEVEAIYDQFTCVANVEWKEDPLNINAAIDRSAFNRSIMPHTRLRPPPPNLVYERCFAFYDTDNNGLIGFDEFLHGLAYIHKRAFRDQRLLKIFDGYDMDSDGYVSRKDFLRMFRALYTVQQELTNDMIAMQEEQAADEPRSDLINSSQPLSSAFRERFLPGSLLRRPGKSVNRYGDLVPVPGYSAVADGPERLSVRTKIVDMVGTQVFGGSQSTQERLRRPEFYIDEEEGLFAGSSESRNEIEWNEDDDDGGDDDPDVETASNQNEDLAERSRSSSRVRFKDEPEDDARSQTSTSSRPVGERWGGYDIPEAEADVGKAVTFVVLQECFNLLLDPLFKQAEDLVLEIKKTRVERRKWKDEMALVERETLALEKYRDRPCDPLLETAKAHEVSFMDADKKLRAAMKFRIRLIEEDRVKASLIGDCLSMDDYQEAVQALSKLEDYTKWALPYLDSTPAACSTETCSQKYKDCVEESQNTLKVLIEKITGAYPSAPSAHPLYREIKDIELQAASAHNLFRSSANDVDLGSGSSSKGSAQEHHVEHQVYCHALSPFHRSSENQEIDPTLPQFRPNSSAETIPPKRSEDGVPSARTIPIRTPNRSIREILQLPDLPPPRWYLRHLVELDQTEEKEGRRGVAAGKLGFEDFDRIMKGSAGKQLDFLDDWLTLISF